MVLYSGKASGEKALSEFGRKLAEFKCGKCNCPFDLQGADVVASTREMIGKKGEFGARISFTNH